jgi:hypothetical protein
MTDPTWDPNQDVQSALQRIVQVYGREILSKPKSADASDFMSAASDQLGNVPDKTRELLKQAVDTGVAADLERRVQAGLNPDEAVQSVAAALVETTPTDATGCIWVTREFARALGYRVTEQDPHEIPPKGKAGQSGGGSEAETVFKTGRGGDRSVPVDRTLPQRGSFAAEDQRRTATSRVLVTSLALVVIVVAVGLLIAHSNHTWPFKVAAAVATTTTTTTSPSTTTTTTTTTTIPPSQAATNLSNLLAQSSGDRSAIVSAVGAISSCQDLGADEQTLNDAAGNRQDLLNSLNALNLSSLPNGSQLLQALVGAWTNSKASDQSYAAWAADEINGCTPNDTTDLNYQKAQGSDSQSTMFKTTFANLWNPIAMQYNLPTVTASTI